MRKNNVPSSNWLKSSDFHSEECGFESPSARPYREYNMLEIYKYCGFEYYVNRVNGEVVDLKAVEGQHPAAYKDKHRRSAMSQLHMEETKRKAGIW